jgi:hypothetical protein
MRWTAFVIAAALLASGPANSASAWKEYNFPDLGIRKDFPSEPMRTKGTYKTPIVPETPADIVQVEQDGIIYRLTVVPLQHQNDEGASIMGECAYFTLTEAAKALADFATNIGFGRGGIYGRWTSADHENGDRIMAACYFTKAKLYKMQAIVTPRAPNYPNSHLAMRFINALDFNVNRDDSRSPPVSGQP